MSLERNVKKEPIKKQKREILLDNDSIKKKQIPLLSNNNKKKMTTKSLASIDKLSEIERDVLNIAEEIFKLKKYDTKFSIKNKSDLEKYPIIGKLYSSCVSKLHYSKGYSKEEIFLAIRNLENEDNSLRFFRMIKTEYLRKLYKAYFLLIVLIVIYITYQFLMIDYEQIYVKGVLDQIVIWVLFSIFLIIHFFVLSYIKFSPRIVNFLNTELSSLSFEIQRKYKMGLSFFLFNSFSIVIFLFINVGIYLSNNYFITSLLIRLIIIYIFSSITIPILRGILHDRFIVKLKNSYFVQLELQFKLIKRKEIESQMIRIFMISNKLCSNLNQFGLNLHKELTEKRWLHRKSRLIFPTVVFSSLLHFHEYSTPINFKEHFLNIVSAIREWDLLFKNSNLINKKDLN